MTPFLKDLLLITNPNVLSLADYLNRTALLFILPCFYMAIICEYFTNWNFKDVAKRALIAFLAIKLLTPLHVSFVNESLTISSQLVKKYSPQNKFLTAYNHTKMDRKTGVWKKLSSIVEMIVTDPIVLIIFLLSYISFFLLTQLYSLIYHLGIVLIGLCAVLSIFPITSRSLVGAVKTSLWCVLMPFVVAIVLCLIGDSDAFLKTYSGGIVQNLESLIQLLIMTVILLMTPMITSKIMSDSGISSVAENIGQMAAMSTLIGGAGLLTARASMGMKQAHNLATRPLINGGKKAVSNKASEIMEKKGIAPKVSDLSKDEGFKSKLQNKSSQMKDAIQSTSLSEKLTLATDSIINRKENLFAKEARKKDAGLLNQHQEMKNDLVPLSSYKKDANAFIQKNQTKPFDLTPQKFSEFKNQERQPTQLKRQIDDGAFVFKQSEWRKLSPQNQLQLSKQYGLGDQYKPKDGFIYFPIESQRSPLSAALYNKTMKPKTIKELRDAKTFLK